MGIQIIPPPEITTGAISVSASMPPIAAGSLVGSITVGSTPTLLKVGASNLIGRHTVLIQNDSSQLLYIGYSNTITVSNSVYIPSGQELRLTLDAAVNLDIYGLVIGNPVTVRVSEIK